MQTVHIPGIESLKLLQIWLLHGKSSYNVVLRRAWRDWKSKQAYSFLLFHIEQFRQIRVSAVHVRC